MAVWTPGGRLLTAGLVFMVTAVAFEGLAIPTALPATLEELSGLALYGWAFSGYWLSNLVGIAMAGAEADRRGPLLPLILGVVTFSVGLLLAGLAPSMGWVVVGRLVQGLGSGAIAAITYVAVARGYDPAAQPRMIAMISSAWVLPGLVGPALAGWVSEELSWRWTFIGLVPLLPLAALAVAGPVARLSGSPRADDGITRGDSSSGAAASVRDAAQLALGAGALLSAASFGDLLPRLVAAGAGLLLLLPALRRLMPPGALTARTPRGAAVATLALVSVAFFGTEAFIPLAVASVRNAGTLAGGLALTVAAVTWAAGSWIQARLALRRSRRSVTLAGVALVAAGVLLVGAVPLTSVHPLAIAAPAWAVAGLGMGLAYSTATLAIIGSAEKGGEGAASASAQLANTLGIALGTGVAGGVVALSAQGALGMAPGIVLANLVMLVVLVFALHAARRMSASATSPPER